MERASERTKWAFLLPSFVRSLARSFFFFTFKLNSSQLIGTAVFANLRSFVMHLSRQFSSFIRFLPLFSCHFIPLLFAFLFSIFLFFLNFFYFFIRFKLSHSKKRRMQKCCLLYGKFVRVYRQNFSLDNFENLTNQTGKKVMKAFPLKKLQFSGAFMKDCCSCQVH